MELTKKQKNCPYCCSNEENHKPVYTEKYGFSLWVYHDRTVEVDYIGDGSHISLYSKNKVINYCPMCGRRLNNG